MKTMYEGGEEEKNAGPQTDRPGAGEEQLAEEKEEPPASSLAKPQDESNVEGLDQSQSELPLRGKDADVTKVKSKKVSKNATVVPDSESGGPMAIIDSIEAKYLYVMKWKEYILSGYNQKPTAELGALDPEEPEYRTPKWLEMLEFVKKWGYWIVAIILAITILITEFDKWAGLKSQEMQVFKRRVQYYDMDKQMGGIASLLPVHFFQRWVKLDVIEILECVEKQNERACYSVARRNCIAIDADPKGWDFLNCMFTAIQKSTIDMGDYCKYHFDDDVEETWEPADIATQHFVDQRYACKTLASGKSPTYCVEKYELKQASGGWDEKECQECFRTNSNERWVLSGCDAELICDGLENGRDCDIWPKVAALAAQASASSAAA